MNTYTTEEIQGWILDQSTPIAFDKLAAAIDDPQHGIAAWKAGKSKDAQAEWITQLGHSYNHDGTREVANRLFTIADRLEALQKKSVDDDHAIEELASKLMRAHKRVAELEAELAKLSDPLAVHMSMIRGVIAWTPENVRHLLGDNAQQTTEGSDKP